MFKLIIMLIFALLMTAHSCSTVPDKIPLSATGGSGTEGYGADQNFFSGFFEGFKYLTRDEVIANTVKYSLIGVGGLIGALLVGSAIKNRRR